MSRLPILIVAAITAPLLVGCASSPDAPGNPVRPGAVHDPTPIDGDSATLIVYGMSCPLCANNVDSSLLDVPGVGTVDVDMSTGVTVVSLDGSAPVTRGQLADAVDRSGFSLQRIEP